MKVTINKFLTGTFVETHTATFDIPDDIDPDDAIDYLESEGLLDSADWQEDSKDDNINDVEYEVDDYEDESEDESEDEE